MGEMASMISELGLGAGLAILMFIAFFFLLKWVLEVSKDQLNQHNAERIAWGKIIDSYNIQLKEVTMATREFQKSVRDAHAAQNAEHKEMITCLGRINGYKD